MTLQNRILQTLLPFTNFLAHSADADQLFHPVHAKRIHSAIDAGLPVVFALPAFPAKSPNPDKTMGNLPDLGELLSLYQLNQICLKIRSFYSPGARVVICSDGRVFSDLVGVPDVEITAYTQAIQTMISEHALSCLSTFHLEDTAALDHSELRDRLVREFGQDLAQIRSSVLETPAQRQLFNGMHRFLFEDQWALNVLNLSRNQVRERSKTMTYELIRRSDAWSRVVEEKFPHAVRLSIHPQLPQSRKIGVQLVPTDDPWRTPWHSVPVVTANGIKLMKRVEAESLGAIAITDPAGALGMQRYELTPMSQMLTAKTKLDWSTLTRTQKEPVYA